MGILTEEMKRVVAQQQLCYAATVTPDGKPNLSPNGSITVLSDTNWGSPISRHQAPSRTSLTLCSEAEGKRFWLERYACRSAR